MSRERIDKLSPSQEQLLDQLATSLRIDAVPKESMTANVAETAIRHIYQTAGYQRPHVVWCENPFELAVMPILLELIVQYEESVGYSRLLGEFDSSQPELKDLLISPLWQDALMRLTKQCPVDIIASLAHDDEKRHPSLQQFYEQFHWSKCGVSGAEPIWAQTRKHISHVVGSLERCLTLSLSARLTNQLYTVPNDEAQNAKRTVREFMMRDQSLRLRDEPLTVFGTAQAAIVRLYQRATELHEQIGGSTFEKLLRAIPAPQADPALRRPRNLKNDAVLNSAGILAFGPYQTLWGYWASFAVSCYSTIAQLFPGEIEDDARYFLSDMSAFLRSGFAYNALTRVVFIWKYPLHVEVDAQYRLHSELAPAMLFRDGYKIYALHGVPVPADLIEHPELLSVQRIDAERNVELRRVLIDRYGISKYLQDTGAGIMDKTERGTLYLKQLPGDEALAIVQVKNSTAEADGTYKEYFLRVPPTCRTAQEAIAWTFGMTTEEYDPAVET
jgi:hypothetical protein